MSLAAQVSAALARIQNPRLDNDLLSAGMIRDLVAEEPGGKVSFTFLLGREDPATLVREARAVVGALEGVNEVKITGPSIRRAHPSQSGPPGQGTQSAAAGAPPPPTPIEMPD